MKTWLQWVSTDRSYAKCVLGTKTLTLPTQDNGWLSAPPTELCNYHDKHSQQRPDTAGQINNKVLASQSLYWTPLLTEGIVSKQPPPYPTSFDPQALSTHPLLGQPLGYPAVPTKKESPLLFWTPNWPGAGLRPTFKRSMTKLVAPSLWFHMN